MNLGISQLHHAYRHGTISVRQLMQHVMQAIDHAPKEIWIARTPQKLLDVWIDRLERLPPKHLPLYGIPFAVKDNIDIAGLPTTAGCAACAALATRSATVVERLMEAGAIPVGKTNMDQLATGLTGTQSAYGTVPNRFASGYIAGGSSSGSAAALAYNLCSFSLGTDTAGSGRIPAAFNDRVGFKPSRGLVSMRGILPCCRTLDCVSIFTYDAADAMRVFDVLHGLDAEDPYSRAIPECSEKNSGFVRMGVPYRGQLEFFGNDAYERAFRRAISRLEVSGCILVEIDFQPFLEAGQLLNDGAWIYERYATLGSLVEKYPQAILPAIQAIIKPKEVVHPSQVFKDLYRLQELKVKTDQIMSGIDLLLTPTAGTIYRVDEVLLDPLVMNANLGYYTQYTNVLDYSAIALPAGMAGEMPFGITLAAPTFRDRKVLFSALRLESTLSENRLLAVVGPHLSGGERHHELESLGAQFVEATRTAPKYHMYAFQHEGLWEPALIRCQKDGVSCYCEVYEISSPAFEHFARQVHSPLAIGTVELQDGQVVHGFIGEGIIAEIGRDISVRADWRLVSGTDLKPGVAR